MDKAISRGLQKDIGSERYTAETKLSERNVNIDSVFALEFCKVRISDLLHNLCLILAASAIFSAKVLNSLFRFARRRRSSCSDSNSSSSPYICRRLLFPVSSNCISEASR